MRYRSISGCTLVASGCVHGSACAHLFAFGLMAADAAASATLRDSTDGGSGSILWRLGATASTYAGQSFPYPIWATCGMYVTLAGTGASAMVAWS